MEIASLLRAGSVALVLAACSQSGSESAATKGRVVVAVTIDWEGAYLSPEGLDALDALRKRLQAPITHFVSAAYFTKEPVDPTTISSITEVVHRGDELALHVHAWRSLAKASGIEPKLSPSFLTGTDKLLEFEDGDTGFDVDLDTYDAPALRALVRTSRRLLEQTHLRVSSSFRAGGYLGTPKLLQAIQDEGFTVDSSAIDYRQLDQGNDDVLSARIKEIWPHAEKTTQPYVIDLPGGPLLEMPIAAVADYATGMDIVDVFEAAHARLQQDPSRDVFVVLGFHLETAAELAGRLGDAIDKVRRRRELGDELVFTTVESAAALAAKTVAAPPR
ncbi:MAG: hypothetical protein JWO36_7513 [Myxococcales bacterium]|nr:hypothetical protein [Myxococcales bacterium]